MPASAAALHVYTDGAYAFRNGYEAYGWVLDNPAGAMPVARVVSGAASAQARHAKGTTAAHMEAAAIVDALCEFAPRGRALVIHSDSQCLPHFIEKYRRGEIDGSTFLNLPNVIREADAWRLLRVIDSVQFTFEWVKGHGGSFPNLVIDQALRLATRYEAGDRAAVEFAEEALVTGEAVVWGTQMRGKGAHASYFKGASVVCRAQLDLAA